MLARALSTSRKFFASEGERERLWAIDEREEECGGGKRWLGRLDAEESFLRGGRVKVERCG